MEQLLHKLEMLNLTQWDHGFITLIAVAAWIGLGVMQHLIRLFRQRIARDGSAPPFRVQSPETNAERS